MPKFTPEQLTGFPVSLQQVHEFHSVFGHMINLEPVIPPKATTDLRVRLLVEELTELEDAIAAGDIIEVMDALTDLQYVLDGAYLEFGVAAAKNMGSTEVHMSNMSKLGEDGKPILREDGKILKGPNYWKPDFARLFTRIFGE